LVDGSSSSTKKQPLLNGKDNFLYGLVAGIFVSTLLLVEFAPGLDISFLATTILSATTYLAFILIVVGYVGHAKSDLLPLGGDLLLGLGIGLLVVYFVTVGPDLVGNF
jgi:hypothetical protein